MENFAFLFVRCFCRASTFIHSVGTVGFQHLLHFGDSSFLLFNADSSLKLGCIRSDYLTAVDDNLPFQMRPALIINELGLQLLTCKMHDGGTKLRMIHAPMHPICQILSTQTITDWLLWRRHYVGRNRLEWANSHILGPCRSLRVVFRALPPPFCTVNGN